MPKPNVIPTWARFDIIDPVSGQNNVVAPDEAHKNYGWAFREKPPRQFFNWLGRLTHQWIEWFDEKIIDLEGKLQGIESSVNTLRTKSTKAENIFTVEDFGDLEGEEGIPLFFKDIDELTAKVYYPSTPSTMASLTFAADFRHTADLSHVRIRFPAELRPLHTERYINVPIASYSMLVPQGGGDPILREERGRYASLRRDGSNNVYLYISGADMLWNSFTRKHFLVQEEIQGSTYLFRHYVFVNMVIPHEGTL